MGYFDAVDQIWRAPAPAAKGRAALRELVRCASLAPSSHNTQCWRFRIGGDWIAILPDLARRCPVVDPDDHHLFVSLGCAAENVVQAAPAFGLIAHVEVLPQPEACVRIGLTPGRAVPGPLFKAIAQRECSRSEYDGKPVPAEELARLEAAATGAGARAKLITGRETVEQVLQFIVRGNTAQLRDRAFLRELRSWIRFSDAEAVARGDGLAGRTSGNPSLPRWLGSPMLGLLLRPGRENRKIARQVRSSAGIAVFFSDIDDARHRVEAGRCYQRFALQATRLGIRNAFLNQPVEVTSLRREFAHALGLGDARPDLVVRFGRGPLMPRSLRRPLEAVIEA